MNAPAEIPLLLKGPLVRQFLAGRKTVTRRMNVDYWTKKKPGDLIYFRETHAFVPVTAFRMSEGVQQITDPDEPDMCSIYRAGWERSVSWKWRPSIHMPKWAARCWAEIVSIRVERLQDMSLVDAFLEGCPPEIAGRDGDIAAAHQWFVHTWDSINSKRAGAAWKHNPLVARIEFRRIER